VISWFFTIFWIVRLMKQKVKRALVSMAENVVSSKLRFFGK